MKTLVIDNFQGRLTRYNDGDITKGYAKYDTSYGYDPFSKPGNLTWFEAPTRIDTDASVLTDLVVAARPRLESGTTYVYAVGSTGRFYKIKSNDTATYNPNYDSPSVIATLSAGTPTFKYGSSLQFYGDTERVYVGHDKGVNRVDFTGANDTLVTSTAASVTSSVPRPSTQFAGKTYWGNGNNLIEIDSTATASSYYKLSPSFPVGTQVRDLDVSPDGNYIQAVVSRVSQPDITAVTQDTNSLSSADSYFIFWNGTDTGYTAYNPYNAYSLNSNTAFGPYSYTTGYDLGGAAVYSLGQKILSFPNAQAPNFNAMFSVGNMVGFVVPEQADDVQKASMFMFGAYDREIPEGLYRLFRVSATSQTDIVQVPVAVVVSNLFYGHSAAGYTDNMVGSAKIYFATLEYDDTPTTSYKFWRFNTVPTGSGTAIAGVYETQSQLFSKKVLISEVRLYVEPLVANNEFTVDLIGSDGSPISNGSKTFTVGTNCTAGDDYLWWKPAIKPTYAVGVRITNSGSANWTLSKLELDVSEGGK
jgi:hypothetical protein